MAETYKVIVADSGEEIWIAEDGEVTVRTPKVEVSNQMIDCEALVTAMFGDNVRAFTVDYVRYGCKAVTIENFSEMFTEFPTGVNSYTLVRDDC